jgi:hypothetical protein
MNSTAFYKRFGLRWQFKFLPFNFFNTLRTPWRVGKKDKLVYGHKNSLPFKKAINLLGLECRLFSWRLVFSYAVFRGLRQHFNELYLVISQDSVLLATRINYSHENDLYVCRGTQSCGCLNFEFFHFL